VGIAHRTTNGDVIATRHIMAETREVKNDKCYKRAINAFHLHCFDLSEYEFAMRRVYALANLCSEYSEASVLAAVEAECDVEPSIVVAV